MKAYLIDEIPATDMEKVREYLEETTLSSRLDRVFWVRLPDDLLSPEQLEHVNCRPHVFAVELGPDWVKLEFFVRSLNTMRCTCPGYAGDLQRRHILSFADNMIRRLRIRT